MRLFYRMILLVGVAIIVFGVRLVYVGQTNINDASADAELAVASSKLLTTIDSLATGAPNRKDTQFNRYIDKKVEIRLSQEFESKGQNQRIFGGVLAVFGLLMSVFGWAKNQEISNIAVRTVANDQPPASGRNVAAENSRDISGGVGDRNSHLSDKKLPDLEKYAFDSMPIKEYDYIGDGPWVYVIFQDGSLQVANQYGGITKYENIGAAKQELSWWK